MNCPSAFSQAPRATLVGILFAILSACGSSKPSALEEGFNAPPVSTKPWVYWYWLNDNVSKEGISRDLEAMAAVGIGEALIGNIFLPGQPSGDVKALTAQWWALLVHAVHEGRRTGVNIGLFNSPGWSQSGGPWVQSEQAMRHLVQSETRVEGPGYVEIILDTPAAPFQGVAVLAFPAPASDDDQIAKFAPRSANGAALFDGKLDTSVALPSAESRATAVAFDVETTEPFTARSLLVHVAHFPVRFEVDLQMATADGEYASIRRFSVDRGNPGLNVGPEPWAPVAVAFPPAVAQKFRVLVTQVEGSAEAAISELELTGAARLERFAEKQLKKLYPGIQPAWDAYLWPPSSGPGSAALSVQSSEVLDISDNVGPDGTLRWEAPPGAWIVQRIGLTPTGVMNAPAAPEAQGLEVDKMSRQALAAHFEAYVGQLLKRLSADDRKAFTRVVADSYETGSQNWTDDFRSEFRDRYHYDAQPFMPVLTGRIVDSPDRSDRFLWDLRRLVADRIASNYVGGLRELSRAAGLELWLENYGHWGFPGEFLQYGGATDRVGGEFWESGEIGGIECRAASSAAHTYGMPITSAEAFTGGPPFISHPWSLKKRGDWSFAQGINHFVLSIYMHQPWADKRPGVNAWFGTEFNRHNTWFSASKAWIDYNRRSHFLLQQGRNVADVAYFIGEDTPKMTGTRQPELPPGYSYDYINADVIQTRLTTKNGRLWLPDGTSYQLLVLPPQNTMRPALVHKLKELVSAGAAIYGPRPEGSPSLEGFPHADDDVRAIALELWGTTELPTADQLLPGSRTVGKGRVFSTGDLATILSSLGSAPDVNGIDAAAALWAHRTTDDADIYFVSNQTDEPLALNPEFRVKGRVPEIWHADTTRIDKTAHFQQGTNGTSVRLLLAPRDAVFVMFRPGKVSARETIGDVTGPDGHDDVTIVRSSDGLLTGEFSTAGLRTVVFHSGERKVLTVPALPPAEEISGPFTAKFPSDSGAPTEIVLEQAISLSESDDPSIRHFAGTVLYEIPFSISPARFARGCRIKIDLGAVAVIAEVVVNGKSLGTLWKPPFVLDVTDAARVGENKLEVRVTNTWRNGLLAPANAEGVAAHFLTWQPDLRANDPLDASGLLGPVRLLSTIEVNVPGN